MTREIILYEVPQNLETVKILDNSLLGAYNDSVMSSYNSNKARGVLNRFSARNREIEGSNPFMLVHLQNSGLLPARTKIATRQNLEKALKLGLKLPENYVDFGLTLKTAGDSHSPNDLPARILAEQLKKREIKLESGKLIPISALKVIENTDSAYGLVFDLKDGIKELEDLSQFKWNHQKDNGLACAGLGWYGRSNWFSDYENLDYSFDSGRVVLVTSFATSRNFLDLKLKELWKKRDKEITLIQKRYAEEEKILLDNY